MGKWTAWYVHLVHFKCTVNIFMVPILSCYFRTSQFVKCCMQQSNSTLNAHSVFYAILAQIISLKRDLNDVNVERLPNNCAHEYNKSLQMQIVQPSLKGPCDVT